MIRLTHKITRTPDFTGFLFYVEAGNMFELEDYREAYRLGDIDPQSVQDAQAAACLLETGDWLEISHNGANSPL